MLAVISRCKVWTRDSGYGCDTDDLIEMKLVTAAVYTNFRTTTVNDDGIEAIDAYTVHPTAEKLVLQFHPVS